MKNTRTSRCRASAGFGAMVSLALLCATARVASASAITPGFDYFTTPPGGAFVDLGFGPIPLQGIPLPNFTLGVTDTVVARMDPGPPPGGTGIIDIELVALHLRSVAPVDLTPIGGPPAADLHITIDAGDRFYSNSPPSITPVPNGTGSGPSPFGLPTVPTPDSTGNMEMFHGGPGPHTGATMRAVFADPAGANALGPAFVGLGVPGGGIFASAFAVIPGGDPANPADVFFSGPAPPVTLGSTGAYIHTLDNFAENGGLLLTTVQHVGPHPHAQPVPDRIVPEPSTGLMLMLGGLVAGSLRHGRRCRAA